FERLPLFGLASGSTRSTCAKAAAETASSAIMSQRRMGVALRSIGKLWANGMGKTGEALERLVEVMRRLRAENGCPWDREQDLRSLRPYLVEETYEVLDEMDRVAYGGPWRPLCEELGDLLFQIVFHAQLASELKEFDMGDVANAISEKIVSRHPHVFGELKL